MFVGIDFGRKILYIYRLKNKLGYYLGTKIMSKKSIRFFNDCEVRAVWDEENNKWWFSVVDIVEAITESPNLRKYWSVLKARLKKVGNELTTCCSQLKLVASDGKKYATDCFAQEDIVELVKVILA